MGVGQLKSGRSRMRGNNLSYEIFKGVNCGGSFFFFFFFLRLVSGSLTVSVLTFARSGQLLSHRLFFLSRLICDHDLLGC